MKQTREAASEKCVIKPRNAAGHIPGILEALSNTLSA